MGALLLIVAGIMRAFFVDVAIVGHNAMAPTIVSGEQVLVWTRSNIELGDIAICENPGTGVPYVVGRVIATEGMNVSTNEQRRVTVEGTVASVQSEPSVEFYDRDTGITSTMRTGIEKRGNTEHRFFLATNAFFEIRPRKVGAGRVYLLGDNRSFVGMDSRYVGDVEIDRCIGQVFMRLRTAEDDEANAHLGHAALDIIL